MFREGPGGAADDAAIRREVSRGRIEVIGRFSWLAMGFSAALAVVNRYGSHDMDGDLRRAFLGAHVALALIAGFAAVIIYLFRQPRPSTHREPGVVFAAAAVVVAASAAYAIMIAALDALVTGTGASYVLIVLVIGYVAALPLIPSLAAFGSIYLAFVGAMLAAQADPVFLRQSLIDGTIASIVACNISFLGYRRRRQRIITQHDREAANRQKDRLISLIAHDIRSPLTSLALASEQLETHLEAWPLERTRPLVGEMASTVRETLSVLDRLVQWARAGSRTLRTPSEAFALRDVVGGAVAAVATAASRKGVTIASAVDPTVEVRADGEMVDAALRNLLSNAIKYSSVGDVVRVEASRDEAGTVVRVVDHGIGMGSDELDAIRNAKTVRSRPGTRGERGVGIGLQIVHELVAINSGQLLLDSEPGRGTTATLILPRIASGSGRRLRRPRRRAIPESPAIQ